MSAGMPTKELAAAYEATHFVVLTEPARSFVVGEAALTVAPWLASMGATRAVIITAWNPFSQPTSDADNAVRQDALCRAMLDAGARWLPAEGRDPTGTWRPEPSFCVLDPSAEIVDTWLVMFEQNAVVQLDNMTGCSLVWHPVCR